MEFYNYHLKAVKDYQKKKMWSYNKVDKLELNCIGEQDIIFSNDIERAPNAVLGKIT